MELSRVDARINLELVNPEAIEEEFIDYIDGYGGYEVECKIDSYYGKFYTVRNTEW